MATPHPVLSHHLPPRGKAKERRETGGALRFVRHLRAPPIPSVQIFLNYILSKTRGKCKRFFRRGAPPHLRFPIRAAHFRYSRLFCTRRRTARRLAFPHHAVQLFTPPRAVAQRQNCRRSPENAANVQFLYEFSKKENDFLHGNDSKIVHAVLTLAPRGDYNESREKKRRCGAAKPPPQNKGENEHEQ